MASFRHRLVVAYLRAVKRKQAMTTPASLRRSIGQRRQTDRPDPPRAVRRRVHIERCDELGFPVYTTRSRRGDSGRWIVYTHGGSYVNTLVRQHWKLIAVLAERLAATVVVPDYPLAPEHTWRESFSKMVDLAGRVAADAPSGCTLVGDSAGGGYSLAVAQRLAARGVTPLPLVLIAPFVDLTMADPEALAVDPVDPWLSVPGLREAGRLWAGADDPGRWEVSPLFGRFSGVGPMLIFSGTRDVLNPQAHDLADRASSAGAAVVLVEEAGLVHVYPLLPIPEARPAIDRMVHFVEHAEAG